MKIPEAIQLIKEFEEGTLPKEKWTHHAHFVMALWYCYHFPLLIAVQRIKEGIKKYNERIGGKNTSDAGYHETITQFYIYAIAQYILQNENNDNLERLLEDLHMQNFLEKNYPFEYYTKELLMNSKARLQWVPPDKKQFCMSF